LDNSSIHGRRQRGDSDRRISRGGAQRLGVVMKKQRRRNTGRNSTLLEHCVQSLRIIDFEVFKGMGEFVNDGNAHGRYVILNFPHKILYGTPGRKEAYIFSNGSRLGCADNYGHFCFIVEAKYQDSSGSVDEKLPYIVEAWAASPVRNWVVVLGGRWWKTTRGTAAVKWLKSQAKRWSSESTGILFVMEGQEGFSKFAKRAWGVRR